jgi:hypothetical protein
MSVEQKSENLKKNVQRATDTPPTEENKAPEGGAAAVLAQPTQEKSSIPLLFDLTQFDQGKLETAESLGIPIRAIADTMNGWAMSVEARFNILANAVRENPKATIDLMKNEAKKAQEEYLAKNPQERQAQQRQGGGGIGGLGELLEGLKALGVLGGGGGGGLGDQMAAKIMDRALDGFFEMSSYGIGMNKAILTKLSPAIADEVTASIMQRKTEKAPAAPSA